MNDSNDSNGSSVPAGASEPFDHHSPPSPSTGRRSTRTCARAARSHTPRGTAGSTPSPGTRTSAASCASPRRSRPGASWSSTARSWAGRPCRSPRHGWG
ncbi:hypothetical protein ACR6C2_02040 [Streptomyces sp. INA 01156]